MDARTRKWLRTLSTQALERRRRHLKRWWQQIRPSDRRLERRLVRTRLAVQLYAVRCEMRRRMRGAFAEIS